MHDILQLALNFYQSPSEYKDLTDPAKPLPENINLLLEIAAGEVESSAISQDAAPTESISRDMLAAATYFVEHVLFIPKGHHYRTLGVEADANPEQIRKHYHLLLKLLYLDREDKSDEWNTSYAMRINHAYSILRDSAKRRSYDQILSKQGIRIVKGDKHYGKEPVSSSSSSANSRPALADLITARKEGDRNKQAGVPASRPAGQPIPEPKPPKAPFIAGNINKVQGVVNGEGKTGTADAVKKADKANKETAISPLTSQELDTFQHLIKAQPAQQNWLVGLIKDNPAQYRTITVAMSVLLLVVVVIYVFQTDESETDTGPAVALIEPSDTGGDGMDGAPVMPDIPGPVESSGMPAPSEDKVVRTARVGETTAVTEAMPAGGDVEIRRRRTIDDVSRRDNAGNNSTRQRSSDGVRAEKATAGASPGITGAGITNEAAKAQSSAPERSLPTKSVTASNATSAAGLPPGQNEATRPVVTEKPATKPPARIVPDKQPIPEVAGDKARPFNQASVAAEKPAIVDGKQDIAPQIPPEVNPISDVTAKPDSSPLPTAPAFVSMVTPPQINNNISDRELGDFIADFVRGYEAGDVALFMNLFADDAQTDDQSDRQGIRKDYQELFQGTDKRQFIIDNLQWKRENNNLATGEGGFKVIVQAKGDAALNSFVGRVSFHVQKGQQGIVIKRLIHTYGQ